MEPHTAWVATLSPWPEEFGLDRMRALLAELGDPQLEYPAIHVVGTNGKSTATRTIAALLRAEDLGVGAYTSPHVAAWHERLDTDPAGFERAVGRIRDAAERVGATQFEALTAAALSQFAEQKVDVAVVEAGLGGRLDATNVLRAPVVHLTNVALDHTDVLGDSREKIAREKLAVVQPGAVVVLGESEWAPLVTDAIVRLGGAKEAAEAFLGRAVSSEVEVSLPGRLERRSPDEVWDGAHNPAAAEWLVRHLPGDSWVVVASILRDKDAEGVLQGLSGVGWAIVATQSSSPRSLSALELAERARPWFAHVEAVEDPTRALERAHGLGGPVLVTGSLYLLADLQARSSCSAPGQ